MNENGDVSPKCNWEEGGEVMSFKVGDKVRILNRDYHGEIAVVKSFSKNLIGETLLDVSLTSSDGGEAASWWECLCFYPSEVEHTS